MVKYDENNLFLSIKILLTWFMGYVPKKSGFSNTFLFWKCTGPMYSQQLPTNHVHLDKMQELIFSMPFRKAYWGYICQVLSLPTTLQVKDIQSLLKKEEKPSTLWAISMPSHPSNSLNRLTNLFISDVAPSPKLYSSKYWHAAGGQPLWKETDH